MQETTWKTLDLLRTTARYLEERGVESPRLAAERVLAHALGCRRVDLYLQTERVLAAAELDGARASVRALAAGVPLQYVVGETEFMGLAFRTDPRALIPRPETEILVDALLKRLRDRIGPPARILELGTGCGAIAVALATGLPDAEVWCTELSPAAAALAAENCRRRSVAARVHVLVMDRFTALSPQLEGGFDCIASNPPYVRTDEMDGLPALVREHEPFVALHGGPDGLELHRTLCSEGLQFLAPGGTLGVEIGAEQAAPVRALFESAGLHDVTVLRDFAGRDRVVLGTR
jgi:release factor glutamine methyltransferase